MSLSTTATMGVSNYWTGIWKGMMELKMKWNSKCMQLELNFCNWHCSVKVELPTLSL